MRVKQLLQGLQIHLDKNISEIEISDITSDSRLVKKNSAFVALLGTQANGHQFLSAAQDLGAAVFIAQKGHPLPANFSAKTVIEVENTQDTWVRMTKNFFGNPSRDLFCIGVTGTNGKTSTTYLLEYFLSCLNIPTGVIGTIDHHLQQKIWPTAMTTPDSYELQKRLLEMKSLGAVAISMEVTSHALVQGRADGIEFNTAIFTQLSRDHLDYHKTMEEYFAAKQKLFSKLLVKPDALAVINQDCEWGRKIQIAASVRKIGFSADASVKADFNYQILSADLRGSQVLLKGFGEEFRFWLPLFGKHNVENAVGALLGCLNLSKDSETEVLRKLCAQVEKFPGIPGRMQKASDKPLVFVDFAHTPDGLEKVLQVLSKEAKKSSRNIVTIFGCGGDRDKGKRPEMGKIAANYSDQVVITSDNPRSEDPQIIIDDILAGIDPIQKAKTSTQVDRKKAIIETLQDLGSDEILLIAGKGHETTQKIGNQVNYFNDAEIVQNWLGKGKS